MIPSWFSDSPGSAPATPRGAPAQAYPHARSYSVMLPYGNVLSIFEKNMHNIPVR